MTVFEQIRSDMTLSEKRMRHTEGVIRASETLAERHFPRLPLEQVRVAALLHDFTKEYTVEQQMELCRLYAIPTSGEDLMQPKLLHARTAAAIAEHRYHMDPDVCSAIRWHTTGRPGMSPLETVLYFADYIEENRTFPSCVKLREYYERQLQKRKNPSEALLYAIAKSFDVTLKDLISHKELIDMTTVEARNYYRKMISEGALLD